MIISRYFVGFVFFSFLGWIWECLYCMSKSGKWENRGFLFGPYCPIYGSGIMLAYFVFEQGVITFPSQDNPIVIFLICMIGSAILEYFTSYILEKKYHARWWDYTNVPFNLHGRIALPISIAFGAAGLILVQYILPLFTFIKPYYPSLWIELISLVLMGTLGADLGITLASLSKVVKALESFEAEFGNKMQFAYDRLGEEKNGLVETFDENVSKMKTKISEMSHRFGEKEFKMLHRMKKLPTPHSDDLIKKLETLFRNAK